MSKQTSLPRSNLFLTGGAGFLGKVILERLISQASDLNLGKVMMLVRPGRKETAKKRFESQIATSPCFTFLPLNWEELVEVLEGDLTKPQFGLGDSDWQRLTQETTHIIHSAASVDFNLPIREAAAANISAALQVLNFAKLCQKLVHMVSVSTAYVSPHREGRIGEILHALPVDPESTYQEILSGADCQADLLAKTGHPNTYTLTKCIAEHLLVANRGSVPLTIVRPSIISAALTSPNPGWIDSYAALAAFVGVFGAGFLRVIAADPEARLDVVPVDYVANTIVDQVYKTKAHPKDPRIVHAVAGLKQAIRIGDMPPHGERYFAKFQNKRSVHIKKIGPVGPVRFAEHLLFHQAPATLMQALAFATGKRKVARQVGKLKGVLATIYEVFPYFTHNSFDFVQGQVAPPIINQELYLHLICEGVHQNLLRETPKEQPLYGKKAKSPLLSKGVPFKTKAALTALDTMVSHAFRDITLDTAALSRALIGKPEGSVLVLAVSAESPLDLVLPSLLALKRPDLNLQCPTVIVPDTRAASVLPNMIQDLLQATPLAALTGSEPTLTVPVTGPNATTPVKLGKTLRELALLGNPLWIVPIGISYVETERKAFGDLFQFDALLKQLNELRKTSPATGKIHLSAGRAIAFDQRAQVQDVARAIKGSLLAQVTIERHTLIDAYEGSQASDEELAVLAKILRRLGATVRLSKPSSLASSKDVGTSVSTWQHLLLGAALPYLDNHLPTRHFLQHLGTTSAETLTTHEFAQVKPLCEQLAGDLAEAYGKAAALAKSALEDHSHWRPDILKERIVTVHSEYGVYAWESLIAHDLILIDDHGIARSEASSKDWASYLKASQWQTAPSRSKEHYGEASL